MAKSSRKPKTKRTQRKPTLDMTAHTEKMWPKGTPMEQIRKGK